MNNKAIRIVQITDMHLFANQEDELLGVKTYQSFHALLDLLKADTTKPDIILLTGDISQDHTPQAYQHVVDAMDAFDIPVHFIPGNHDDHQVMETIFSVPRISSVKHILLDGWQIILLNSQKPKAVEGYLAQDQLQFLEDCLKSYPSHKALILFHHHPILTGTNWLDNFCLENKDELWSLLAKYSNPHTILCGHIHQEFQAEKNGIHCYATPSTCIQFKRSSPTFAIEKLAPAYRWLDLSPDGSLKTDICRTKEYIGVFDLNAKGY